MTLESVAAMLRRSFTQGLGPWGEVGAAILGRSLNDRTQMSRHVKRVSLVSKGQCLVPVKG